ncbi:Calcium/calmodulin-dependent serine/threonine-protein kinase 1 [Hordeum vulgare]|nr:Calcium/calmodulin-dependent serine/threonine-protein kinase 1 [Hordeum vulgare]
MSVSPTIHASRPCKVRKRNRSDLRGQAVQEEEVVPISMMAHQQIGIRLETGGSHEEKHTISILGPNFPFSSKEENSPLKVIDFGLADFVKPDETLNDIVGSVYYVAPEVLHRSYDTEGDMWSIGVIAYILLCGSLPFWVRTESGIFRVVLKAEPRFDEARWPTLSAEAKDFVKRSPMDPRCTTSEDSFRYDNLQAYESLYQLIFIAEVCFEGIHYALETDLRKQSHAVAENGKWNLQVLVKNSTDAMNDSRVIDFVTTVCTLQYKKLDFEEFAASAIGVYQMEAWRPGNSTLGAHTSCSTVRVVQGMGNSKSKATKDDKVSYVATDDFRDQVMHTDDDDADQINIDVANVDEYNANGIALDDNDDNECSTGRGMGNSKSKATEDDKVSDVATGLFNDITNVHQPCHVIRGMGNSKSKANEDDKVSYVATDQVMHTDDDDADQINIDVANVDEYNANGIAVDDNDDNECSTGRGMGNSKSKATKDDKVSDVATDNPISSSYTSLSIDDAMFRPSNTLTCDDIHEKYLARHIQHSSITPEVVFNNTSDVEPANPTNYNIASLLPDDETLPPSSSQYDSVRHKTLAKRTYDKERNSKLTIEQKEQDNARRRAGKQKKREEGTINVQEQNQRQRETRMEHRKIMTSDEKVQSSAKRKGNYHRMKNTPSIESIAMPRPDVLARADSAPSMTIPSYTVGTDGKNLLLLQSLEQNFALPSFAYYLYDVAEDMGAFISTIVDDDTISSAFMDDEYYLFGSQGIFYGELGDSLTYLKYLFMLL